MENLPFGLPTVQRAAAAILFQQAATNALDVYSAVNSSPWTAETVTGGDPAKEASLTRYCTHAVVNTVLINGMAAWVAGPGLWIWPVIGATLETAYMSWLYYDAVQRGRSTKHAAFGVGR
jgi:hypothetical protein